MPRSLSIPLLASVYRQPVPHALLISRRLRVVIGSTDGSHPSRITTMPDRYSYQLSLFSILLYDFFAGTNAGVGVTA